jgi:hypothetical protein
VSVGPDRSETIRLHDPFDAPFDAPRVGVAG